MDAAINDLLSKIREANGFLAARIKEGVLDIQHDADADILYIAWEQSESPFSLPIGNANTHVYLRVDLNTYRIVGVDILHFKKELLAKDQEAQSLFAPYLTFFGEDTDWRVQLSFPDREAHIPESQASIANLHRYIHKTAPELVPA